MKGALDWGRGSGVYSGSSKRSGSMRGEMQRQDQNVWLQKEHQNHGTTSWWHFVDTNVCRHNLILKTGYLFYLFLNEESLVSVLWISPRINQFLLFLEHWLRLKILHELQNSRINLGFSLNLLQLFSSLGFDKILRLLLFWILLFSVFPLFI